MADIEPKDPAYRFGIGITRVNHTDPNDEAAWHNPDPEKCEWCRAAGLRAEGPPHPDDLLVTGVDAERGVVTLGRRKDIE